MMAPIANVRRALCALRMDLSPAEFWLAMGLVGLDIVARLAPHAPNFTPVAASALFAGTVLRGRALALSVPLAAMFISDLVLGCPDGRVMGVVYAALAVPALLGRWGRTRGAIVLAPLAVSSSLIFFATTNFAVWAFSGMYTHDLAGLVHCYIAALPFLHNTLLGDMFWTTLLFASWWSARFLLTSRLAAGGAPNVASPRAGRYSRFSIRHARA